MKTTQGIQIAIDHLRTEIIGLYKENPTAPFELVLNNNGDTIDTVFIGNLGGVHENFAVPIRGQLAMFPDGESMHAMMQDPFAFDRFLKDNFS
jgi:hypothetical protein